VVSRGGHLAAWACRRARLPPGKTTQAFSRVVDLQGASLLVCPPLMGRGKKGVGKNGVSFRPRCKHCIGTAECQSQYCFILCNICCKLIFTMHFNYGSFKHARGLSRISLLHNSPNKKFILRRDRFICLKCRTQRCQQYSLLNRLHLLRGIPVYTSISLGLCNTCNRTTNRVPCMFAESMTSRIAFNSSGVKRTSRDFQFSSKREIDLVPAFMSLKSARRYDKADLG
jgi:hypothetical protein